MNLSRFTSFSILKNLRIAGPLLFALTLASAFGREPQEFALFDQFRNQVKNYDTLIKQIESGDSVTFSSGKKFKVGKKLGSGNTSIIYELLDQPGKAIRIPIGQKIATSNIKSASYYMERYQIGETALKYHKIPMVEVTDSSYAQYTVVSKLDWPPLLFSDFLYDRTLTPRQKEEAIRAFKEFAETTAPFQKIGDFHSEQLAYDKTQKKWVLFDWGADHKEIKPSELAKAKNPAKELRKTRSVFAEELMKGIPPDFYGEDVMYLNSPFGPRWLPKRPDAYWIAKMANEAEQVVAAKRREIFLNQPHLRVGAINCLTHFVKDLF